MKNPVEDMKNLLLVGDTWYVRAMVHGVIIKQTLRTSSLPVAQSRRDTILRGLWASADEKALLTQVQRQLVGIASEEDAEVRRVDKGLLLADAFARWEKDPARAECNPRQVENHRYNWNAFMTWMHKGHPEIQYCRQVAPEIGREWAAHIYAKMRSTNTYNKYISTVHYVFRILAGYDAHIINPMTGVSAASALRPAARPLFSRRLAAADLAGVLALPPLRPRDAASVSLVTVQPSFSAAAIAASRVV